MPANKTFTWKLPPPNLETSESPVPLFEKFFTENILQYICNESKVAISKGKHNFCIMLRL